MGTPRRRILFHVSRSSSAGWECDFDGVKIVQDLAGVKQNGRSPDRRCVLTCYTSSGAFLYAAPPLLVFALRCQSLRAAPKSRPPFLRFHALALSPKRAFPTSAGDQNRHPPPP